MKDMKNFISTNKLDMVAVLTTRIKQSKALGISRKIRANWKWLYIYKDHVNGRILVGMNLRYVMLVL